MTLETPVDLSGREPAQLRDLRWDFLRNPALAAEVERFHGSAGAVERHLRAVTAGEPLRMEIKPREMLLDPILPVRGLAMVHAMRGFGKTHLSLGIAVAVASVRPGTETGTARELFCRSDLSRPDGRRRQHIRRRHLRSMGQRQPALSGLQV
jgi:hypothetical protein